MTHRTLPAVAAGAIALALALTGCTAPEAKPTPTPTPSPTAAPIAPSGDGILRVGTLVSMTGTTAAHGDAQVAGTELAAREIFDQGGVLGKPIVLVHRNSAADIKVVLADFVARGVDVVLWDLSTEIPTETAASIEAAKMAVVPLGEFVHGTPVTPDKPFTRRLLSADPGLTSVAGGAEAYDGLITASLAATVAADDGGPSIASKLESVGSGQTACTSWGECLAALADDQQIRFVGVTGERS